MNMFTARIKENWKAGLTVALISLPLSIALSVGSGAGPVPGIITGIWATLIASFFASNDYDIIGAAGALTSVLFAATLAAPLGLGAAVLPAIAVVAGLLILVVWMLKADRFLYYIPSSVMYGFAAGVAVSIAVGQLFDASGLSLVKRAGTVLGDLNIFAHSLTRVNLVAVGTFVAFFGFMLLWKKFVPWIHAVIPSAVLGVLVGVFCTKRGGTGIITLGDKFGVFKATIGDLHVVRTLANIVVDPHALRWILSIGATVALIAVLETLVTARVADKITKKRSSARGELFGLALANIGAGLMGGIPATGVFIRTGINIKAGATHRTSAGIAAVITAILVLCVLPFFVYMPMPVVAAMLVSVAVGLIEMKEFKELFHRERVSFWIAIAVLVITVLADAGTAVVLGALAALLYLADRKSRGYFSVFYNYTSGGHKKVHIADVLEIPEKPLSSLTYSLSGFLGYIDAGRHAENFRRIAHSEKVPVVVLRLRNLFVIDFESEEMLVEAVRLLRENGKRVYVSSASPAILEQLCAHEEFRLLKAGGFVCSKAGDALKLIETGK